MQQSSNVITFPGKHKGRIVQTIEAVEQRVVEFYELRWTDRGGKKHLMRSSSRNQVKRQMSSLMQRRIMAEVRKGGELCGSIMRNSFASGRTLYHAFLEGDAWNELELKKRTPGQCRHDNPDDNPPPRAA